MNNVLDYFEKTAVRCSHHVAVEDSDQQLTWEELLRLSRRIGTGFSKMTDRGKPIVLLMEKSPQAVAAMFGAVYAGCFYVMIDPNQPQERIQGIFKVLSPEVVVLDDHDEKIEEMAVEGVRTCLLQDVMKESIDGERLSKIREKIRDTDLLYGIFTSGSTGVPKGVAVSQRAVMDFIGHFIETFGFTEKDRIGNQAPFDFDVSVKDIYTSIMTGATLILIPKKLFSIPPALLDYLCEKRVNTLIWAVSALTFISSLKGFRYRIPTEVKRVMFSGEVMPIKQLRIWQEALPEAEFVNLYGPSEITCNCTYYPVKRIFQDDERLPLGMTFPGRDVFLLNEDGERISAPGKVGEICVAGESLAEGYYCDELSTKAKFIEGTEADGIGRYYCTGDLGYYDVDGELYFSGRKDFQIKHMGHRIELEEIEHALNMIDGLERSCCLLNRKKNQLVAFYYGAVTVGEIQKQLKKKIPSYMRPHKIIQMEKMPLNKNGKTDRDYFRKQMEVEL